MYFLLLICFFLASIGGLFLRRRSRCNKTKRVLITGAGSGLGLCATEYLLSKGDSVVAIDVNEEALTELKKRFNAKNPHESSPSRLHTITIDITKAAEVRAGMEELAKVYGNKSLDGVVNFAGVMRAGPLTEMKDEAFHMVFNINVLGTFHVNKYAFPLLKRGNPNFRSRIVNVASEVSLCGVSTGFSAPYAASKFAIEGYSTGLRQEMMFLPDGPYVVVINPGPMKTAMTTQKNGEVNTVMLSHITHCPTSEWKNVIPMGEKVSQKYIEKNLAPAQLVAEAIDEAIHRRIPPRRIPVNVSYEMRLASLIPQVVLDYAVSFSMTSFSDTKSKSE